MFDGESLTLFEIVIALLTKLKLELWLFYFVQKNADNARILKALESANFVCSGTPCDGF